MRLTGRPETFSIAPVTYVASLDRSHRNAEATSSGVPPLFIGMELVSGWLLDYFGTASIRLWGAIVAMTLLSLKSAASSRA
jgi:hypothetical protein